MAKPNKEILLEHERFELKAKSGGGVLGYDNAHDYHHRHYMGEVKAVDFISYQATLEKFQQEWVQIVKSNRGEKS